MGLGGVPYRDGGREGAGRAGVGGVGEGCGDVGWLGFATGLPGGGEFTSCSR